MTGHTPDTSRTAARATIDSLPRLSSLAWGDETWTGEEVSDLVARTAEGLHCAGVRPESNVALMMRNCPELLVADRAVRWLGARPVPINWHSSPDEASYIVANCGASMVIAHGDLVEALPVQAEVVVLVPRGGEQAHVAKAGAASVRQVLAWEDVTVAGRRGPLTGQPPIESIIYTSGTTGRPKGVLRAPASDEQRRAGLAMRKQLYGLNPGARLLITAPLYHAAPLQFAHHVAEIGELVVIVERFDPEAFLRDIERLRITHTFAVPTMFSRILSLDESTRRQYDVSTLEFVLHAGAPCPPSLKKRMIDEWGPVLFEYYGSTELGPVTFCSSDEWLAHPGTVGRPLPGVELAFIDAASGLPGAPQPAEIAVHHSAYPDFSYIGDDRSRTELQRGPYVATGDVGYFDSDGYLFVCDRVRDMIISGGVNIYPAEIEAVIQELPGVQDCAVFGIADQDLGETVAAAVQPVHPGSVSVEEVRGQIESKLGRMKHPRTIELRASLPRAETGKIRKLSLRAEFDSRAATATSAHPPPHERLGP